MPIYEYQCKDCQKKFEIVRPMKDADAQIVCTKCGGVHTSRKLSLFFAQSGGRVIAGSEPSCASCSSGSCATCKQ